MAILTVTNKHSASCGEPPEGLETGGGIYTSYFENEYGEQWLFRANRKDKTFQLFGGDIGWNEPITSCEHLGGMIFNLPERFWVCACLAAVGLQGDVEDVMNEWNELDRKIYTYT